MLRLRLSDVRAAVAKTALVNTTNTEAIADYVNRAQERLLYQGKWVGTYGRYRVCVTNSCITLPRELETIEAAAVCNVPTKVRGEWFEFLEAGPGIVRTEDDIGNALIDRGEACCFTDPIGTTNKLAAWCQRTEADGAFINVQFYDINGQWVTSSDGTSFIDGENIALSSKGTFLPTSKYVMPNGLIRVRKPVTNGIVNLFAYNVTDGVYTPLAQYQPDETDPVYRRYLVPCLTTRAQSSGEESCSRINLDIAGKMRHLPARRDDDYLMISHSDAVRLMVQAVKKEEDNLWDDVRRYEAQAIKCLEDQLGHYKGDGETQPITFTSSDVTGPAVENMI